jgi:hypothetical protein
MQNRSVCRSAGTTGLDVLLEDVPLVSPGVFPRGLKSGGDRQLPVRLTVGGNAGINNTIHVCGVNDTAENTVSQDGQQEPTHQTCSAYSWESDQDKGQILAAPKVSSGIVDNLPLMWDWARRSTLKL